MTIDSEVRKEIERVTNRTLDFNPQIQSVSATTDPDIKGVDNAHIFVSAGVVNFAARVDGVPFKVAMTSAF